MYQGGGFLRSSVMRTAASIILSGLVAMHLGCDNPARRPERTRLPMSESRVLLHEPHMKSVAGDFDGDGLTDTVREQLYAPSRQAGIDSVADPFRNEWDSVVTWYHRQGIQSYLSFVEPGRDTLRIGTAQGLYCLLNIGDNNGDGRDEIAFVISRLDYSSLNSCRIYTLCGSHWTELSYFNVHERAFEWPGNTEPRFEEIRGYLERHEGRWYYAANPEHLYEDAGPGRMTPLKIPGCK